MTSLWQLTGPEIHSDVFEAGHRNVVVIGAGITGLTTAVLLARAGQSVTVLEARRAGALTTGNTTGKLSLLQGSTFSEILERSGEEALWAYAEANREGQAWLLRQLETWGVDAVRRPAYTYATEPSQVEVLEREREAAVSVGVKVGETSDPHLPYTTFGALTLADQAQLHPLVVLAELTRELRARGGTLIEQCRVSKVDSSGGNVEVVSSQGVITADTCVLATGIPILDRALFFAKVEPSRSFAAAYRLHDVAAPQGMYVSVGHPTRSLRTAADSSSREVLIVGGGDHVTGRAGDTRAAITEIDAWVAAEFGSSERVTWWGAQDYRSHSRLPYAGELPRGGGRVYTATGFNKWGMTNGVAAALTIAADILGGHLEWAQTMREHALRLQAVRDALEMNVSVAGHAVSGWAKAELKSAKGSEQPQEGEGIVVREGASPVGIARVDGSLCRVSAVCPHLGGILNWNGLERSWDCPLHSSRFTVEGERLEGPAVDDLAGAPPVEH